MNVLVAGGGPAGLAFAYFLKKNNRNHTVQVHERRRADESAGWGVTLPSSCLGDIDYNLDLHRVVSESSVRWDDQEYLSAPADVVTISRDTLIEYLSKRCVSVGVDLRLDSRIQMPGDVDLARFDLVVGADGINSVMRRAFAEQFSATAAPSHLYHTWLATPKLFGSKLVNILREHNGALLNAWGYQFSESLSCFIVECTFAGLQKSGFTDVSNEEGCRRIARAFATDLDLQPVMSGVDLRWTRFELLKTGHWHHRNVVLIGDAAHTVHFSQGQGTVLAVEDAMCLAKHIGAASSVSAALSSFERERVPEINLNQMLSMSSCNWYHSVLKGYESHSRSSVFAALHEAQAASN